MNNSYLLLFLTVFSLLGCNSSKKSKQSFCIENKINSFQPLCEDAKVTEYLFQQKQVYVFDSGSCQADLHSDVYSKNCELIGRLGGITGNLIINGESFQSAEQTKILWEKQK